MKFTLKFMLPVVCFLIVGCSSSDDDEVIPPKEDDPIANDITYTKDIAPLISSNCIGCHSDPPQNGAPFSLTTFSNLDARASGVFNATNSGAMPPSGKLPQASIDLISDWIDGGKKE